jgi:AraC family transcriptional regulator
MNEAIQRVIYYIEEHLDQRLNLLHLAKVAGYSHFHFCKIFKIHIGESAISYATRLKLERAAKEMIQGEKRMIDIALDAGYQTPTGFLKAFKLRFGTTPTHYRQHRQTILNHYKEITMSHPPKIVTRESVNIVFHRELGAYEKSSDIAWQALTNKLNTFGKKYQKKPQQEGLSYDIQDAELIGIIHDDPKVTDSANIRYDASIAWSEPEIALLAKEGFNTKSITGGKYATTTYVGESNGDDAWYGLYAWIDQNGYTFADAPAFEKYLNGATERDKEKHEIEVYVPIL